MFVFPLAEKLQTYFKYLKSFKNISSHNFTVQNDNSLWEQKLIEQSFLVIIKIPINGGIA